MSQNKRKAIITALALPLVMVLALSSRPRPQPPTMAFSALLQKMAHSPTAFDPPTL